MAVGGRSSALLAAVGLVAGTVIVGIGPVAPPAGAVTTLATCPEGSQPVEPVYGGESVGPMAGELLCATVFTGDGTFTPPEGVDTVDVLVVGGGGGGGAGGAPTDEALAGGGGGGGQVAMYNGVSVADPVTVTVGAGGTGGVVPCTFVAGTGYTCPNPDGVDGIDGGESSFGTLAAAGGFGGKGGSLDVEFLNAGAGGGSPTPPGVTTTAVSTISDGGSGGSPVSENFGFLSYTYNAGGGGAGADGNGSDARVASANCGTVKSDTAPNWICGGNGGPGLLPTGGKFTDLVWQWFGALYGTNSGSASEFGFGPGGAGAVAGIEFLVDFSSYRYLYDRGAGVALDGSVPYLGGQTIGATSFSNVVTDGVDEDGNDVYFEFDGITYSPSAPNRPQGKSKAWRDDSGTPITYGGGGSGGVGTKEVLYGATEDSDPVDAASDGTNGIVIVVFLAPAGATPTTTTYTGDSGIVSTGASINLGYLVDPAECVTDEAAEISYWLIDGDGVESPIETNPLVITADMAGVYDIVARFSGNDGCEASEGSAVLVVGGAGDSVTGGGTYDVNGEISGSNRAHFGFTVQKTDKYDKRSNTRQITQRGQLLWMNNNTWRLKASLYARWTVSGSGTSGDAPVFATTTCPSGVGTTGSNAKCGVITGQGVLQRWNGLDWETATEFGDNGVVNFNAKVYDGGTVSVCKQKRCTVTDVADWFGIRMGGVTTDDGVPVGDPVPVRKQRNGAIVIRS